jgi:hypothetical protein
MVILMPDGDYDLGYFEGVRNCFHALMRAMGNEEAYLEWLNAELKNAKQLRVRWDNEKN